MFRNADEAVVDPQARGQAQPPDGIARGRSGRRTASAARGAARDGGAGDRARGSPRARARTRSSRGSAARRGSASTTCCWCRSRSRPARRRATLSPRIAASRAIPAPLMPPPMTSRSKVGSRARERAARRRQHGVPAGAPRLVIDAARLYHTAAASRHPRSSPHEREHEVRDVGAGGSGRDEDRRSRRAAGTRRDARARPSTDHPARSARATVSPSANAPAASVGPSMPSVPAQRSAQPALAGERARDRERELLVASAASRRRPSSHRRLAAGY